jgi:hypothetical protein
MTNSTCNLDECLHCTECAHLLAQYETLRSRQAIVNQKISSAFTIELALEAGEITIHRTETREAWMRHWAAHRGGRRFRAEANSAPETGLVRGNTIALAPAQPSGGYAPDRAEPIRSAADRG